MMDTHCQWEDNEFEDSVSGCSDESGLDSASSSSTTSNILRKPPSQPRIDSYRFSMANLEESHEAELDAILGELSALEQRADSRQSTMTHNRSGSDCTQTRVVSTEGDSVLRDLRTDSPDNDSAFSDTVSLLSSESSASSGAGSGMHKSQQMPTNQETGKTAKIQLALQKLAKASIRRLFVKAFSSDGASKSLLVDERMSCGLVTRLLADKNHVKMEPHWALVEHLTDLQMERLYEDHELLVDNLMLWSRDSKNRVLFLQRPDKVLLFARPEEYLAPQSNNSEHDEHSRSLLLEEFFNGTPVVAMEGPLYLKSDTKKGWKKYHFVLRASGLYYYPKEKGPRSPRDLQCLSPLAGHELYRGVSWKKKHRAPSDQCFALKPPRGPPQAKGSRGIKMLCAEDAQTLEKWIVAVRIAKHGKRLLDNHRLLLEDLAREELDILATARSGSVGSIAPVVGGVPLPIMNPATLLANSLSSGRLSRASSSSSSGCLSDENGFESEFPMGTIKRKPSMKPNLPLTSMTRQLKEVGDTTREGIVLSAGPHSPSQGGTLTRRHSRRRSDENSNSGTLKRIQRSRGSVESMGSSLSGPPTPTPTPSSMPDLINRASITSSEMSTSSPTMPVCMTESVFSLPPPPPELDCCTGDLGGSTLSLDSLPPPPPPLALTPMELGGSSLSLVSLPPPPPPLFDDERMTSPTHSDCSTPTRLHPEPFYSKMNNLNQLDDALQAMNFMANSTQIMNGKTKDATNISHKLHNLNIATQLATHTNPVYSKSLSKKPPSYKLPPAYSFNTSPAQKSVSFADVPKPEKCVKFADSPVLLRRKVSFEDQKKVSFEDEISLSKRLPPIKCASVDVGPPPPPPRADATRLSMLAPASSPKRLSESTSNPPRDFLKDLQRVMRRKWQVAQKCKLEPATTPHEVLGFRDPPAPNPHYRETNVSNWVQEHYGDSLYENLGNSAGPTPVQICNPQPTLGRKRPPPPPPKRSESTQLTTNRHSENM